MTFWFVFGLMHAENKILGVKLLNFLIPKTQFHFICLGHIEIMFKHLISTALTIIKP